jgi:putative membrane protein
LSSAAGTLAGVNAVTQIFAIVAGLLHVLVFGMESLLFRDPRVRRAFLVPDSAVEDIRLWAFNQGFYNLFVAAGAIGGVIAVHAGHVAAGRAVALYACGFMALCGVVLVVSERRLWRGALAQSVPPLVALVAALA